MDLVLLVVAFLVILLGAELFTNGIEWFGHKLGLAEGAVGSVLAAVGTALPETMIPLIAILFGGGHSDEVGIGAILGAPFMLATLAMFVTGVAVLASRRSRRTGPTLDVSGSVLVHDMRYFAIAYALAIAVAFLPADLAWPRFVVAGAAAGHLRRLRPGALPGRGRRRRPGPRAAAAAPARPGGARPPGAAAAADRRRCRSSWPWAASSAAPTCSSGR